MNIQSKTILLFTCLCFIFTTSSFAQTTIPNGDFEGWQSVGSGNEEPTNWSGTKTGGGNATSAPNTVFKETSNVHGGAACLKLENGSFFFAPINASATTGRIEAPTLSPSDGYIRTKTDDADFSSPFTGRPDSLVGWYKYDQSSSVEFGRIQAVLHDSFNFEVPDQGNSAAHLIGETTFNTVASDVNTWTRFSVPFTYSNSSTPSYILLIATATAVVGDASVGTTLWVDDLQAVYNNMTSIEAVNTSFDTKVSVYPNPTQGQATLDLGDSYSNVEITVTDLAGRVVYNNNYFEGQSFNLNIDAPAGMYIVSVVSESKHAVIKLMKQ